MPIPEFVVDLRSHIGHAPLFLSAVSAIVVRATPGPPHVLLTRRSDTGAWAVVSGIIEPGEEAHVTAVREALEETGVEITPERVTWVYTSPAMVHANGDQAQYLEIVLRAAWVRGEPHAADDESTDVAWFPVTALPDLDDQQYARLASAFADRVWLGFDDGLREARTVDLTR